MQQIRNLVRRVLTTQKKPAAPTRPVVLQPADLKAVSGAGPNGTWDAGPNGTW